MAACTHLQEREAAAAGAGVGLGAAAGGPGPRRLEERGAPSKAIAVEDVFANPNMLLPRKRGQDRKARFQCVPDFSLPLRACMGVRLGAEDFVPFFMACVQDKEKEKRMKGQSAIGSWKSEAEMVLRQQYDS